MIDSEHVAHAHHRHGEASAEREHGHFPITFADFERLPSLISPKNVDRFSMDRSSERIVYAKEFDGQLLIAVEELRKKTLILKTMYKQKLK